MSHVLMELIFGGAAVGCVVWFVVEAASAFARQAKSRGSDGGSSGDDVWPPPPNRG
jgi:hypothetical protein